MAEHTIIQKQTLATTTTKSIATQTTTTTTTANNNNKFHIIAKKKLEKIKNKFAEFFLSSTTQQQQQSTTTTTTTAVTYNSNKSINQSLTSINESELNIYTKQQQNTTTTVSHAQNNNNRLVHDLSYIPHNAFLFSNIKNLRKFHNQYQTNNADDEDFQTNLFDRTFMINYIAFRLINELKLSDLVNKYHLDLRIPYFKNEFSLIYNIAKHIYQEAESEPMGLNGLNIIIDLELNDLHEKQQTTITKFRFNPNSTITTFELKLVLKEDSSIMCLRKFLPKAKLFDKLRKESAIYLDSKHNLIKRKLY